jgi:hypothetical protein
LPITSTDLIEDGQHDIHALIIMLMVKLVKRITIETMVTWKMSSLTKRKRVILPLTMIQAVVVSLSIAIYHLRLTQTNRVRVATSEGAPIGSLAKGMSLSRALGVKATVQRFCM